MRAKSIDLFRFSNPRNRNKTPVQVRVGVLNLQRWGNTIWSKPFSVSMFIGSNSNYIRLFGTNARSPDYYCRTACICVLRRMGQQPVPACREECVCVCVCVCVCAMIRFRTLLHMFTHQMFGALITTQTHKKPLTDAGQIY